MKVDIITLFPRLFDSVFNQSIIHRAREDGALIVNVHDLRAAAEGPHGQADDYIYGGGAGMLMKPEPFDRILSALTADAKPRPMIIFPSPQGTPFTQRVADELASVHHLIFLCGHYKGVDQRVIDRWVDCEYSLGDYVITGGELAAAVMIDAAVRGIPDVLGDYDSARSDSFRHGGLDAHYFTRPEFNGNARVPGVLTSGNHENIENWRRIVATEITRRRRPDLLI